MGRKHSRGKPENRGSSGGVARITADSGSRALLQHREPIPVSPDTPKPAAATALYPSSDESRWQLALVGAALVLAGLHLGLRVQPVLRQQLNGPVFFLDAPFLAKFTSVPGGLLEYAAAALAQLNFHNAAGAVALTVVWAGIARCAHRVFRMVSSQGATAGTLVLLALLAALSGRYQGEVETAALSLLAGQAAAVVWIALPPRFDALRLAGVTLMAAALFYAAGTFPTWLFVATVAAAEALARGRRGFALGCAAPALLVPSWTWLRPGFAPFATAQHWGEGETRALFGVTFAFVPVWLALLAAGRTLRRSLGRDGDRKPQLPRPVWAVLLAGSVVLVWLSLDTSRRAIARLELATARQEWNRALVAAREVRAWTAGARLNLMRALYHAGRLPEDLFSFPQNRGLDLLPGYDTGLAMSRALGQTLFELGAVNLAEHMAHEALELEGARPDTLRLLARINVLKDRPEAARIFLHRLRLAPFHRAEAERALQDLADDPRGTNQAELALIRLRLPTTDLAAGTLPTEALLKHLLTANRTNHMAYAYLLTHRLLSVEWELLAHDLAPWVSFGYSALPRPCAEAVQFARGQTAQNKVVWEAFPVPPATVARYQRFVELSQRHRDNSTAGRAALAAEFGDTFWYYQLFGQTAPASQAGKP